MLDKQSYNIVVVNKERNASDQLRELVELSGKSRYKIWQQTGVTQAVLSRFMNRKGWLSARAFDKVCACIGVERVMKRSKRKD